MTDLNELSDEALRLALARALERNAHLEALVASIGERVVSLDRFTPEWMSPARYAKLAYEDYESEEAYLEDQKWVLEEREKQEKGDAPYPYEHECPFFSERFLYSIFGKDDARTILALFHDIQRLAEEDDSEMERRKKRKEEILRAAQTVLHYHEKIERIDKYLDPEYGYRPKDKDDETLKFEREGHRQRMLQAAERVAEAVTWHAEDW